MSSDDLSKNVLCRLCLSDSSVSYPIFAEGSNLADKILECTSIKVEPVEGVPSNICEICKSKLVICSQFVKQCHDIDLQIREKYESFFKIHHDNLEATCDEIEIIDCVPGQDETLTDIELTECLANKSLEEFEIIDCIPYQEEVSIGIEQVGDIDSTSEVVYLEVIHQPNDDSILILKNPEEIEPIDSGRQIRKTDPCSSNTQLTDKQEIKNTQIPENSTKETSEPVVQKEHITQNVHKSIEASSDKSKKSSITGSSDGIKKYKKPCPICGVLQQNLKQHMNVHSGAKKHVCKFCNKAFSQKGNLTCHLNIHTGNKPHKCDQCDEAFGDPTALKMHKIKHSDEPKFQCDVCQATLKYRHSLQTHMRSHRNERRHACTYCEMAFVTSSSLKKHIRTHTGDRPYKCTDCPKTFICAGHLHAHKKTHSSTVAKNTENRNKATNRPTLPRCSRKTKKGHKIQNT